MQHGASISNPLNDQNLLWSIPEDLRGQKQFMKTKSTIFFTSSIYFHLKATLLTHVAISKLIQIQEKEKQLKSSSVKTFILFHSRTNFSSVGSNDGAKHTVTSHSSVHKQQHHSHNF